MAKRSRGTPRIANARLWWTRNYAASESDGRITLDLARLALDMAEVDREGLDKQDRRYLETLVGVFEGGPTGVEALAATMNLPGDTLSDEIEPYLLREQFIVRTPRGRVATPRAFTLLGRIPAAAAWSAARAVRLRRAASSSPDFHHFHTSSPRAPRTVPPRDATRQRPYNIPGRWIVRNVMRLLAAACLATVCFGCGPSNNSGGGDDGAAKRLKGGGSTFINPLFDDKWIGDYAAKGVEIDYTGKGSGGGISSMIDGTADFGCTDAPMSNDEIKQAGGEDAVVSIPLVMGAVVPIYNLEGVKDRSPSTPRSCPASTAARSRNGTTTRSRR